MTNRSGIINPGLAIGLGVLVILVCATLVWTLLRSPDAEVAGQGWTFPGSGQMPISMRPLEFQEFGPATCIECHASDYEEWTGSHHHLANRPIDPRRELEPFLTSPAVYEKDGERFRLHQRAGNFFLEVRDEDGEENYPIVGLLGVDPLYNFLVALPDGRVQSTTLAWDVHRKELFDTFDGSERIKGDHSWQAIGYFNPEDDERLKGDYGHWLGQGLNWNANCAWCHMTDFRKNLDIETLGYRSDWFAQGITCRQCHPGSDAHVTAARAGDESVLPETLSMEQIMHNCYSCHSRRGEITENAFQPGDNYHDHFMLSLPDQPGLYFPDGQIYDEVFAGASFEMSAMGQAGVTCMDCHDPHSLALILPSMNNALCQRCHAAGLDGAQVIEPEAHAFHSPQIEGGRCVDCHMPQRVYMARDPRHDHNFPIPDPFLTLEMGVPNACNQCHIDESVEWAAEWVVEWYGEDFHERREHTRARARLFHDAHRGTGDAAAILAYLDIEPNPAWRAALTSLLGQVAPTPQVMAFLEHQAADPHPMIRERTANMLATLDPMNPKIETLLEDEFRAVRIATIQAHPPLAERSESLTDEWREYIRMNADRPQFTMLLAREALENNELDQMRILLRNAVSLGPNESEIHRQVAILYSEGGLYDEAESALREAIRLEPENPQMLWTYGLFLAERERLTDAIDAFRQTLEIAPHFPRGTYNLIVALAQAEMWDEARFRLRSALRRDPANRELQQLQRWMESIGQWQ